MNDFLPILPLLIAPAVCGFIVGCLWRRGLMSLTIFSQFLGATLIIPQGDWREFMHLHWNASHFVGAIAWAGIALILLGGAASASSFLGYGLRRIITISRRKKGAG